MRKILRVLADLRFAIILLLIISLIITIGSIIEQDQSVEYYQQNYPIDKTILGFLNWEFIIKFELYKIYRTLWFVAILILFGSSLISCSFFQQFPTLKFSRHCHFSQEKKIDIKTIVNKPNIGNFLNQILKQGYFIFQQKKTFYATKGLLGRVAPVFVHLSIILILFGSIIAAVCGFNSQELITKAEVFHIQNTIGSGPLSFFSQQPIRVNDFWINYYTNTRIKQFFSNISILDENGKELVNKTISVNKPLIYKNLTLYQTDWTLFGVRLIKNNEYFQLPVLETKQLGNKIWVSWLPINFNSIKEKSFGYTVIINNFKETISLYDLKGNLLKIVDKNEYILNENYKLVDFLSSTGLQIKSDPGVRYIYFGFGILMVSTILSYLSFSQIWIINNENKFIISAKTNRTKVSLNTQIFKLTKNLK